MAELADRQADDVRQGALNTGARNGPDGEVPRTLRQIIEDVGLHADGCDLDALVEIRGAKSVVNAVAGEIGERRPIGVSGRRLP